MRILIAIALISTLGFGMPGHCADLLIRPHPQVMQPSEGGFRVTAGCRILIPKGWPVRVQVSAQELAKAIQVVSGIAPAVVEVDAPELKKGDIVVGTHDSLRGALTWIEPAPPAINRPDPADGYNIRIIPGARLPGGKLRERVLHGSADADPDGAADRKERRRLIHAPRHFHRRLAGPQVAHAAAPVRRLRHGLRARRAFLQADNACRPAGPLRQTRGLQQDDRAGGGSGHRDGLRPPPGAIRRGVRDERQGEGSRSR